MIDLTDQLWNDMRQLTHLFHKLEQDDGCKWGDAQGDVIFAIDRMSRAANLINTIDAKHRPNNPAVEYGEHAICRFDGELWPCWHHRQIHPEAAT